VVSKKSVPTRPYRVLRVQGGHKRAFGGQRGGPLDGKRQVGTFDGGVQASKWKCQLKCKFRLELMRRFRRKSNARRLRAR
jgi:hypothetical protein